MLKIATIRFVAEYIAQYETNKFIESFDFDLTLTKIEAVFITHIYS